MGGLLRKFLRTSVALVVLTTLLQLSETSLAQGRPPWLQMTVVQVEPTSVDEFLAAQGELSALEEEAGTSWRSVTRTAIFGDTYQFLIMSPFSDFSTFGQAVDAGPDRAAVINRIRSAITSRQTYALRATPAIDNPLPDDEEPTLMLVQFVSVLPGREQEYLRVMVDDVLPYFDEAEMHHTSGAIMLGGASGYVHVFHVENFAELDQGSPLAQAVGVDGAQEITAKLSGVVTRIEQWLVHYLPNQSFRSDAKNEADSEPF